MSGQLVPRVQHQIQAAVVIALGRLDADEHIVQRGGGRLGRARGGLAGRCRRFDDVPVMLLLARVRVQLIRTLDVMMVDVVVVAVALAVVGDGGRQMLLMGGQHDGGLYEDAIIIGYVVVGGPGVCLYVWELKSSEHSTDNAIGLFCQERFQRPLARCVPFRRCLHMVVQTHSNTLQQRTKRRQTLAIKHLAAFGISFVCVCSSGGHQVQHTSSKQLTTPESALTIKL